MNKLISIYEYLFQVHVMPMNIYGGSGAPSRVVPFWGDGHVGHVMHSAATTVQWTRITLLFVFLLSVLII